jgi:histidine kinase-like protein
VLDSLRSARNEVDDLIATDRVVIQLARAVYMPDGAFDPDAMLDNLRDLTAQALKPTWTPGGRATPRLTIDAEQGGWRHPVTLAVAHGGLPDDRVQDFLVAVTEVVANALQHGDTTAQLALWVADAGTVLRGPRPGSGPGRPAGRLPATQRRHRPPGMGLWVARQLAIASGPNGTVVRFTIGR